MDVSALDAALAQLKEQVEHATSQVVEQGGAALAGQAQDNAPVKTGALRRSIYAEPPESNGVASWTTQVAPHVIYARIQELGGVVTAHGDYSLHNPATGQYFGHSVYIPGKFYLTRAVGQFAGKFQSIASDIWGAALGG